MHYLDLLKSKADPGKQYLGAFAEEKRAIEFEKYLKTGSARVFIKRQSL